MTRHCKLAISMGALLLATAACKEGGGSAHQDLCKRFCETAVAEVDACAVAQTGCHLKSAAFSDYVKECTDDCIDGFSELSSEEKPGVEDCLECINLTATEPQCNQIDYLMDFDCDDDCDEADIYEFNDYVSIGDPDPDDIDC